MSFVMIPEELLEVDISAAQLRALIHIINNTYSSGKYAGCCCLGYQNLADLCFTHKGAAINTLKQLERLGFIEINRRERFNRSNAIKLTLENGYERCRNKSGDCSGNTPERSLNRTFERSLNRTEGSLNRTLGSLNRTPHIDLKFKNLDLKNKNTCACAEHGSLNRTFHTGGGDGKNAVGGDNLGSRDNQIAPVDGATGRTKPNGGQTAESLAKKEVVSTSVANDEVLTAIKSNFPDILADLSVSKAGNCYILRKKGKFALIEDIRLKEVAGWLNLRGFDARPMDCNTRVLGEILLS